jgi:hypothetical protein
MKHGAVVTMPETSYLKEHKRLINLLDSSKDKRMKTEADKQKKEIREYLKKKKMRND